MSMEIDFSTPLTNRERAFLLERGRYADIERADNAHGTSTDESLLSGDGSGPSTLPLLTGERTAQRREELLAQLAALDAQEGVGNEDAGDESDDIPPYEAWKVADLDDELKRRKLPVTGDKAAKAKALYDDDETAGE